MTHPGRAVAERIGRAGVWTFQFDVMPVADVQRSAARIEEMGAGAIWIPESVVSKVGSGKISVIRTRHASAKLMGTSAYFSMRSRTS